MIAVIVTHLCAALIAPALVSRLGRRALLLLALAPAVSAVYAMVQTPTIMAGGVVTESWQWIPALGLNFDMRLDMLSWIMSLIVGLVGAIVLVHASSYFTDSSVGLKRYATFFTAFAGVMFGLVTADHTMVMYTFWEATSLLSYLLIGHHHDRRPARTAARQALLVTTSGALAMFAGLVMLGQVPGGSYRFSDLIKAGVSGQLDMSSPLVATAAFLVLAGALAKSAQLPFHFWLPGAMTAPTPVSSYLHAAAMVKAGVYLIARLTPAFTLVPGFSATVVTIGALTMLIGAARALRQYDLKLLLAHGTVSQLGLIIAVIGYGTAEMMAAGMVMLIAHACFKSSLFLTVGAIEQATGRRDWRRLTGLARRKPVLAVSAAIALGSMAGLPFTAGYLGKEAMITSLLHGSGAAWVGDAPGIDLLALIALGVGSVLTAAYAWRAWWGAFGSREVMAEEPEVAALPATSISVAGSAAAQVIAAHKCLRTPFLMTATIALLASGAFLGLFPAALEGVIGQYSDLHLPGHAHLAWWSGIGPALVTAGILALAALLAWRSAAVETMQRRLAPPFALVDIYAWSIHELEIIAAQVTRFLQRGSLPWDISTIVVSLVAIMGGALLVKPPAQFTINWFDSIAQLFIVISVILAAILTVRSRGRMRAAILLGGVGLGVALLWASQGAPDLAITQVVVEAVSIVVFVLVLRRLPKYFSDRPLARSRWWRVGIAVLSGIAVVIAGVYASSARIHEPVSALMPQEAYDFGHGKNIVNVILVDIRAWDTVGELSVLLVIATGVASLIHVRSRGRNLKADRAELQNLSQTSTHFLPSVSLLPASDRSTVMEVVTRLLFPTMIVISLWLLLIGHNNPGGGFVGGVVAGLAFLLRYLAGGRYELTEAMPVPAGRILGLGLFIAGLGALLPLLFQQAVLQSAAIDWDLGPLGQLHFSTAMLLDIGVYVLVIGLVLDLVSTLGSEIDVQKARDEREAREQPGVTGA